MGWARFDDGYMDHPKIMEAGHLAELLDRRAIEHCAKYETDGLVTRAGLRRISRDIPKVPVRVAALVQVGRWLPNETGGWWLHDYLKYNPSKAAQEARREAARVRMNKSRSHREQLRGGDGSLLEAPKSARVQMVEPCHDCGRLKPMDCECGKADTA